MHSLFKLRAVAAAFHWGRKGAAWALPLLKRFCARPLRRWAGVEGCWACSAMPPHVHRRGSPAQARPAPCHCVLPCRVARRSSALLITCARAGRPASSATPAPVRRGVERLPACRSVRLPWPGCPPAAAPAPLNVPRARQPASQPGLPWWQPSPPPPHNSFALSTPHLPADEWDCPDCTGKSNFTCINRRDYCLGERVVPGVCA